MVCNKCAKEIPDDSVLCCYCGRKVASASKGKRKSKRPNGTGSVQPRGKSWEARVVDHYIEVEVEPGKHVLRPVWKTKGGFKTKRDALNYLPTLAQARINEHPPKTFKANYDAWVIQYTPRVSKSTMSGYISAFKHFAKVQHIRIDRISANDLQKCLDDCPFGKRIRQLMKVTAGLVFKYAIDDKQIQVNCATNLWTGDGETKHFEPLTEEEVVMIEASGLEYSDYVVAMCYLGHRPAELFAFTKTDLHEENGTWYLLGGVKTEAGKTRAVTIPPKILPTLQARAAVEGTDFLFPRINRDRSGNIIGYSQMSTRHFSQNIWKPMMEKLGIVGKVPYATRHTYANKMKALSGDEKDKAGLMGHASYDITREHYQTTTLREKRAITDQIKFEISVSESETQKKS